MKRLRSALAVLAVVHTAGLMFYAEWLFFHDAPVFALIVLFISLCISDTVLLALLQRTFQ